MELELKIKWFYGPIMDGKDIFRKLTIGTRFDFKRFHADADKLQVCRFI